MFCSRHPSKESQNDTADLPADRTGFYEDLLAHFGLCFSCKTNAHKKLFDNEGGKQHFVWEPSMVDKIAKLSFRGISAASEKQLHVAGYMFEMCLQLCLSPDETSQQILGLKRCLVSLLGVHQLSHKFISSDSVKTVVLAVMG